MEIINENRMPDDDRKGKGGGRRGGDVALGGPIYLGVILVLAGMLWLFHNLGWIGYRVWDFFISWQMLLVVIGGYLLSMRKWVAGAIVGGIGVLFLLFDLIPIHVDFWKIALPVVVIALGVSLLVSKLRDRDR